MQAGVERAASQSFLPTIKEVDEKGDEESASVCDTGGSIGLQVKMEIPEPIPGEMPLEQ